MRRMTNADNLSAAARAAVTLHAAVPATLAAGAAAVATFRRLPATAWALAGTAAGSALALALAGGFATAVAAATDRAPTTLPQAVLLAFVGLLGLVLVRFTRSYLAGERNEGAFAGWLLATLAGATAVLATDNLLLLSLAWVATSLSLQQLLTFYRERPWALVAAREKFLVGRCADLCMLVATSLLAMRAGSLRIDDIAAMAAGQELGEEARVAMGFVAIAALLKCAQMPFHGWLLRVMEAPTPVSALLHAGVVNLGGFVLLRLAPLLAEAPVARWLLIVVGAATAATAALASSMQPSVKSALAWSTCAQMGFLMLQCGLGLFEMALLHLVAHSAYKAHAFLTAASSVRASAMDALAPPGQPTGPTARIVAGFAGAALALAVGVAIAGEGAFDPATVVGATILALALTPLLEARRDAGVGALGRRGILAVAVVGAWFVLHDGLRHALGLAATPPASWAQAAVALAMLLPLPAIRLLLAWRPGHASVASLHACCQRGWFLDEWFTRIALRTWRLSPFRGSGAFAPDLDDAPRARTES